MEGKDENRKIFNPKHTKKQWKYLRNNMTKAEVVLWSSLKNRKLCNMKFRRQHGIGDYIVDFYCPQLKLAVEVDGESHYFISGKQHDTSRDKFLSEIGIHVIRITNQQIFDNLAGVLDMLKTKIENLT